MVKIEKGVPIPAKGRGRPKVKTSKYMVERMEVGDSVFVKGVKSPRIHNYLFEWKKRHNRPDMKFTVRTEPTGIRFWRTA